MLFRQSMMRSWSTCPLQARFQYLDSLPGGSGSKAVWGTCMHAALDHYVRTDNLDEAIRLFCTLWDDPAQIGCEIAEWNKFTTYGGLRMRGIEILRAMDETLRWETRTVLATEHPFLVPFGRHELTGTVDLVELKKNFRGKEILAIADYKGNARKPNISELVLNTQFTAYIWASLQQEFWLGNGPDFPPVVNGAWWWEMLQDTPRRGIWVQLWNDGQLIDAGSRDEHDFGRLYTLCDQIERAIKAEVFVPNIGEHCSVCSYRNGPCPTVVPSREEWETTRQEDSNAWL